MKLFLLIALAVVASASSASLNAISKFGFPEGRIINGQDAEKGEAKFIVSLQFLGQHFCGGTILSENWVLTAAHCLNNYEIIKAVAGILRLTDVFFGQSRLVTKQIQHGNYAGNVGPNDIGLGYLKYGFKLNARVGIINLPLNAMHDTGNGRVYGFGVDNSGQLSNHLQALNVTVIDYEKCKVYLPGTPINETNLCFLKAGTTDSACSGDSGGPLVLNNFIVGIVSWGRIPCGQDSYPSVFTRVSAFLDWIQDQFNSI